MKCGEVLIGIKAAVSMRSLISFSVAGTASPVLLIGLVLGLCVGACQRTHAQVESLKRFVYRQGHMGMEVRLVLYAPDRESSVQAAEAAFAEVAILDSLLSSYRSDSELMRVNRRAGEGPVAVGYHMFSILDRGQVFARRSDGALDVTAGPLIQLWRTARRTQQLPDSTMLQEAQRRVGWQHLALEEEAQTVAFRRAGMELNLGGLAKGYILDQVREVLLEHGLRRVLAEAGGDLVAGAAPPGEPGWTVNIPHRAAGDSSRVIAVAHAAVATSGDSVQYVEINGTRYSHVINPKTGRGLTQQPTTTVVAPTGITADALATTIGILGLKEGKKFAQSYYPGATVYASTSDSTAVLQRP